MRLTVRVWLQVISRFQRRSPVPVESLLLGSRQVRLLMVRHVRARRYLLRLRPDGTARVTIPRGGTPVEARQFVERNRNWLEAQFQKLQARPLPPTRWLPGSQIWFRGALVQIVATGNGHIHFGGETLVVADPTGDLRPDMEKHLRELAARELPLRVWEKAAQHRLSVQRITVRNQKSRWGSCSRRRTISLNWRLLQTPDFVRDYIILHELAHLRQMNHSARFWQEVELLCPDYLVAERWLKSHRGFIL